MNLKLMCYLLQYSKRPSHTIPATFIALNLICTMKMHQEWEENHKDVEPHTFSSEDWPHMIIKAIKEWLCGCLGTTKIPLA